MWQRFTERARKSVFYAQEEAKANSEMYVSTEHLLLGLTRENDHVAAQILLRLGVTLEQVRAEVKKHISPGTDKPDGDMQLTPRAKRVIDLAYDEARLLRNNYIGTEHLLLGLVRESEALAGRVLAALDVKLEDCRREVVSVQSEANKDQADSGDLLSMDDAAKFLGVSKPTLYRFLSSGELKGIKVGRQWRFRKEDLAAYLGRESGASDASTEEIDEELGFIQGRVNLAGQQSAPLESDDSDGKLRALANDLIKLAILLKASDIHIEPVREADSAYLLIRVRVYGALHELRRMPAAVGEMLVTRLKMLADIDLNTKVAPQEGRIPILLPADPEKQPATPPSRYNVIAQTLPTAHGEAITMRIMEVPKEMTASLDELGFSEEQLLNIRDWIKRPRGIIVGVGPEGSGKTTPLYAMLKEIAGPAVKTFAFADPPVEIPYVTPITISTMYPEAQRPVDTLRAMYRGGDPDVVFYDAVNDSETARLIVEIGIAGHLVLTTIEAPSFSAAGEKFAGDSIEPLLLTRALVGIIVQRLALKICPNCTEKVATDPNDPSFQRIQEMARAGGYDLPDDAVFSHGRGCPECRGRGWRGRVGIFQVIPWNETLSQALLSGATGAEIERIAIESGSPTVLADAIRKAAEGVITIDEAIRVGAMG
jgi:excisionase family DNA binding protein